MYTYNAQCTTMYTESKPDVKFSVHGKGLILIFIPGAGGLGGAALQKLSGIQFLSTKILRCYSRQRGNLCKYQVGAWVQLHMRFYLIKY